MVDNASTDTTPAVASQLGARVVTETVRSIGAVRNTGASAATGSLLFFTDADVALPLDALTAATAAVDAGAAGGAIPRSTPPLASAPVCCAPTGTTTASDVVEHRASPSSRPPMRSRQSADTGRSY
ncbi:glycosyltransferase family A protein [Streptomyces sp. NBC_00162]|uniref:glycosyltransferase family A protein n=1 Tax=Streptomyces sp. NBC_00162 TaxID=2903629 RepID=UPI00214C593A|nr:glycosyltransferase family A protein [Streptomyces sp. NBC_00162]UUU44325.1 glycosyltransferase family 2 protein [Streptomyces sp. NBC_00162]